MVFKYTIDYSLKLPVHTVVSTDSDIIIKYCIENNIDHINRNKRLSKDTTRIEDVVLDAYKKLNNEYKYISLLYADMPTRYQDLFLESLKFLENNDEYDCVLSMKRVKENPEYMYIINDKKLPHNKKSEYMRQNLDEYMIHDGHTILFKSNYFLYAIKNPDNRKHLYKVFGDKIKPLIHNKITIAINDMIDFELLEKITRCL